MLRFLFAAGILLLVPGCSSETNPGWNEEDGYRWTELPRPSRSGTGFTELSASRTGVTFANTLTDEELLQNRHYMNGSGLAVGDVDGDGWTDIYFARLEGRNVLYRNLGGWRFEDVTEASGVAAPNRFSTGAVLADIDGDGDLDLLLTAMGGPNAAYLNDGRGRFTEVTGNAGLALRMGSTSMALSDVDGDGDLDLYIANYKTRSVNDIYSPPERSFERTMLRDGESFRIAPQFEEHYVLRSHAGGLLREERAEPNRFYLNDGHGRFSTVPADHFEEADGVSLTAMPEDWTLTVRFHDVNGDGAPDLYVCNDFQSPDYFWLGDGHGRFRAIDALSVRKTSFSTMSVDFSDIERDGDLDFFLTDMLSRDHVRRQTQVGLTIPMPTAVGEIENRPQAVQNALQLNRGDGTYAEIAYLSGVAASDWTWSGLFLDVDLDGYEDLLLATGHAFDVLNMDAQRQELLSEGSMRNVDQFRRLLLDFPKLPLENVAFRNRGDRSFEFMPEGWGLGTRPDVSNALAFGDFDNDGDLDVVVNRLNETAGIFRNEAAAARVTVRLRGRSPNTQGIGSKIRVSGGGLPVQEKEVISGGQYLAGSDPLYSFAAGRTGDPITIQVFWRSGRVSRIEGIPANRLLEIYEPEDAGRQEIAAAASTEPIFEDAGDRLPHRHEEAPFDDFAGQPLLPRAMSRSGPGLAWVDIDADGDDDLIAGSGRGGTLSIFRNDRGRFSTIGRSPMPARDDLSGLVAAPRPGGGAQVFVGVSNYEIGAMDSSSIDVFDLDRSGRITLAYRLSFGTDAVGPLALADFDGDGDLDLFAGGRVATGRYPQPASSRIYVNDGTRLRYDSERSTPFQGIGLVSGAAVGDLDGDGDADAVLALEWGPIRYFENDGRGRFVDRTDATGLGEFVGWWNGVALGDFDGDGRLDVVATNWGWNGIHGRLHPSASKSSESSAGLRLYYSDFDTDGRIDVVESRFEAGLGDYVPVASLATLSDAMPYVAQRMPTHQKFATSTLRDVIGPKLDRAPYLETNTLAHMVFLNRSTSGDALPRFEASVLPLEAQAAPAYAAAVADYDADGREDIFLSQNAFGLPMDVPRQDAGRGLLLLGDGAGGFAPREMSGLAIYGEQRAAAVSDIDGDGRADLVVTQNGAETKLYRNTVRASGQRIRLDGPPGNPAGVGSVVRLRYDDGTLGPARIISAGSGYWSQSSAIQVLGRSIDKALVAVDVRWPNGTRSTFAVTPETAETAARFD